MTASFDGHIHWYEVPRHLHLAWTRVSEPASWIAESTDAFLRGLGSAWGIDRWTFPEDQEWRGSASDLVGLVESCVSRNSDGAAVPSAGYSLYFFGAGEALGAEIAIRAGSASSGRRTPLHRLIVHPRPLRGVEMTTARVDHLCDLAIRVWEPAWLEFSAAEVRSIRQEAGHPVAGWNIDPAWRLWLSDETAAIDSVADGVTATRMHGGTMLAVPDDWSPERVVETVGETLERNGITEIPH